MRERKSESEGEGKGDSCQRGLVSVSQRNSDLKQGCLNSVCRLSLCLPLLAGHSTIRGTSFGVWVLRKDKFCWQHCAKYSIQLEL